MIRLILLVSLLLSVAPDAWCQSTENSAATVEAASVADPASSFSLNDLNVESKGPTKSAWVVLPLSFVAGFLLNFMPCVLPVVGLKLLSFVQQAQSDRRRILMMNLSYTAGLLTVMWVLATFAVFAGLGWGEQFSSTGFTITLAVVVFAFGLSFLGVWELPLPGFSSSVGGQASQEGYSGAFSKGILSTLLATPCSGPFLGAALAWALKQPTVVTYGVFTTVGIGMASPYLVIGAFPSLIRFLPKPGNWMITFKHLMGFVMLATVVYLLSFVAVASVVPTVLLLLGVGMAVWYAGQIPFTAERSQKIKGWAIAGGIVLASAFVSFNWLEGVMQGRFERAAARLKVKQGRSSVASAGQPLPEQSPPDQGRPEQQPLEQELAEQDTLAAEPTSRGKDSASIDATEPKSEPEPAKPIFDDERYPTTVSEAGIVWREYSPELLETAIAAGRPVFVDFTADWCLTCKSNEAAGVETEGFSDALEEHQVVALRADKTASNEDADELLRKLGNRAGAIPFYAFFNPRKPGDPIVLDGILTSNKPFVDAVKNSIPE